MDIPLDEVVYFDGVSESSTGAAADADSTPTFEVFEEATDTDIGVGGNMTKRTSKTGQYRGSFTQSAANGFEAGKWYVVYGYATIGAVATKGILKSWRCSAAEAAAGYRPVTLKVGTGTGEVNLSSGKAPATLAAADVSGNLPANVIQIEGSDASDIFAGLATSSALATAQTSINSILADTNELQLDWVNGGRLDNILDARASQASVDAIDDFVDGEITSIIASLSAISSAVTTVDSVVDAILLDTGTDGVPLTSAAIDAIHDEPISEPTVRPAWASMTNRKIMQTLGVLMLNEVDSDSNSVDVRNNADDATLWAYPSSDDGTTYTSGKAA